MLLNGRRNETLQSEEVSSLKSEGLMSIAPALQLSASSVI